MPLSGSLLGEEICARIKIVDLKKGSWKARLVQTRRIHMLLVHTTAPSDAKLTAPKWPSLFALCHFSLCPDLVPIWSCPNYVSVRLLMISLFTYLFTSPLLKNLAESIYLTTIYRILRGSSRASTGWLHLLTLSCRAFIWRSREFNGKWWGIVVASKITHFFYQIWVAGGLIYGYHKSCQRTKQVRHLLLVLERESHPVHTFHIIVPARSTV
jgi:hypothetical protein